MTPARATRLLAWIFGLILLGVLLCLFWPREGAGDSVPIRAPEERAHTEIAPVELEREANGRLEADVDEFPLVAPEVSEEAQIGGTVRDTQGRPIAGAWVNVSFESAYLIGPLTCRTDGQGKWVVEHRRAGVQLLEAEARARCFVGARIHPRVKLQPGMNGGIDIVLAAAPGFAGRVLDARTQKPIEGATARIASAPDWSETFARSGPDGRFELASGRSAQADVIVEHDGYAYDRRLWDAAGSEHTVYLQPADGLVSGVLLWPDDKVAAGQAVHLWLEDDGISLCATDQEGRFRFKSCRAGHARIFAFGERRGSERSSSVLREFDLQPGENELRLQLELPPEARLILHVTSQGAPAAQAMVEVTQEAPEIISDAAIDTQSFSTGDDGRLEVGGLLPGRYNVELRPFKDLIGAPIRRRFEIRAGETAGPLEFELVSGIRFAGRVTTPFPGGALTLELWDPDVGAWIFGTRVSSRVQSFGFPRVPPGRYRLRLLDRGELVTEIEVGPNSEGNIQLDPGH